MVTEIVTVVVRSQGAKATARGIRSVGTASRTAAASVRLLVGAVALLGVGLGVRGLINLSDSATRLGNQIRVVTRSTENFNEVQSELNRIADLTRAPLDITVSLFRRLRIATRDLGSTDREVLKVVEGLNAALVVSGANAQEARAGLIQLGQGLASGRLAGDELRTVLEALPPVAQALGDALGVTIGELREMGAAGALNAQVVFPALLQISDEFSVQLQGLSFTIEQVFNILRNRAIRVVSDFNEIVRVSGILNINVLRLADSLENNLFSSLAFVIDAFSAILTTGASMQRLLDSIGISVLPGLGQSFALLANSALLFINALEVSIRTLAVASNTGDTAIAVVLNALGVVSDNQVIGQIQRLNKNMDGLAAASSRTADTTERIFKNFEDIAKTGSLIQTAEDFEAIAASGQQIAANLRELRDRPPEDRELTTLDERGVNVTGDSKAREREAAALKRLLALLDRIRIAAAKRIEPLDAQLERLKQQKAEVQAQVDILGQTEVSQEALRLLEQQRLTIEEQRSALQLEQEGALARLLEIQTELAELAPDLADELERAVQAALAAGGGLEEVLRLLRALLSESSSALQRERAKQRALADELSRNVTDGISSAFDDLINGKIPDFAEALADTSRKFLKTALDSVLEDLADELSDILEEFSKGKEGSGGLAGLGALVGLGGLLVAGAFKSGDAEVTRTGVESAVNESRELRGVIAGPTNIPIFQVGDSIENAFVETNVILESIEGLTRTEVDLLRAILIGLGGEGGAADAGAEGLLGITTPSLG